MDDRALLMFQDEELRPRAMAHMIHSMMAPRISDVAAFRWDYFDFQTMTIQFRAKKNKKRCFQYIQPNLVQTIQQYQSWVSTVHRRRGVPLPHQHPKRFGNHETRQPARNGQNHPQVVEASQRLNDGPTEDPSSHSPPTVIAARWPCDTSPAEAPSKTSPWSLVMKSGHWRSITPNLYPTIHSEWRLKKRSKSQNGSLRKAPLNRSG